MKTLTIHAATSQSAREMLLALSDFQAELIEVDNTSMIVIPLGGADAQIVAVLDTLQLYVTARGDGAAKVDFNGRTYVMHPESS